MTSASLARDSAEPARANGPPSRGSLGLAVALAKDARALRRARRGETTGDGILSPPRPASDAHARLPRDPLHRAAPAARGDPPPRTRLRPGGDRRRPAGGGSRIEGRAVGRRKPADRRPRVGRPVHRAGRPRAARRRLASFAASRRQRHRRRHPHESRTVAPWRRPRSDGLQASGPATPTWNSTWRPAGGAHATCTPRRSFADCSTWKRPSS